MRIKKIILSILCLFAIMLTPVHADDTLRILFVGNSMFYMPGNAGSIDNPNNLPQQIKSQLKEQGITAEVDWVVKGGASLADHNANSAVHQKISSGNYDVVIFGEQSDTAGTTGSGLQSTTKDNGKALVDLAKRNNAKTYFYAMPAKWKGYGRTYGDSYQKYVDENMQELASYTGADGVIYGGKAIWDKAKDNPSEYFNSDGYHPNAKAQKLAASSAVSTLKSVDASSSGNVAAKQNAENAKKDEEYYEDIHDRTILGDMLYGSIRQDLKENSLFDSSKAKNERLKINNDILNGNSSQSYSLYERFGGDIAFVPYLGESSFDATLVDHLYSATTQLKLDKLEIKDIMYTSEAYLGTTAYENRPVVLNQNLVEGLRYKDTRVDAYDMTAAYATSFDAMIGNALLFISKVINELVAILMGKQLLTLIFNLVELLQGTVFWGGVVKGAVYTVMSIGSAFALWSILTHAKDYVAGKEQLFSWNKSISKRMLEVFLCYVFIFSLLQTPKVFNAGMLKLGTAVNDFFAYTAKEIDASNDVIASDYAAEYIDSSIAPIWCRAVYEPWVLGTFGTTRDKLYTHYADVDDSQKINQTHDETHKSSETGNYTSDSAEETGDVFVPLGDNKESRNWADYAWSTQSIYHIDSTVSAKIDNTEEKDTSGVWPTAELSYGDNNVYTDSYRWIDAKLNIGSIYIDEEGTKVANYRDSVPYTHSFTKYGGVSIWLSLLSLTLLPAILQKLAYYVYLIGIGGKLMYNSVMGLFKEDAFYNTLPEYFTVLKKYVEACLKLFILLSLYYTLVSATKPITSVIYIFLAFVVMFTDLATARKTWTEVKGAVTTFVKNQTTEQYQMETFPVVFLKMEGIRLEREELYPRVAPNIEICARTVEKELELHDEVIPPVYRDHEALKYAILRKCTEGDSTVLEGVNYAFAFLNEEDKVELNRHKLKEDEVQTDELGKYNSYFDKEEQED